MNTQKILLQTYQELKNRGVDEDALHDAIVEILPRLEHVKNVSAYFRRLVWQKRGVSASRTSKHFQVVESPSPEFDAIRSETILAVREKVAKLSPRERTVVEHHDFHNKKCREIAQAYGENASAIRGVLFRAHQHLSCSLQAWG